ncbi:MAG: C39 family peptidase [bacterium]|nr:C39 family peptidase [bacterium]
MNGFSRKFAALLMMLVLPMALSAQEAAPEATPEATEAAAPLPPSYLLNGFTYHAQWWNNCGPATLTMALSYFGYSDDQGRAANWLKPNSEDKNVSPWQMVEYVNTQVSDIDVYSTIRYGGTLERLKALVANQFPVIIEAGYDPERANQGWMGHYLLVIGYDDAQGVIITHDSYAGASLAYTYEHIEEHWQHFNYIYMPLYASAREADLMEVLGTDADPTQNLINAFEIAREEATADQSDPFAWFNMGSILVELELYPDAAIAFNTARNLGLPWRMMWYQFGPYEAYYQTGDYQTILEIATAIRNDGGGQYVEETFYYAGLAREGLGETQRAIENYNATLAFNPNFTPARERLNALQGS